MNDQIKSIFQHVERGPSPKVPPLDLCPGARAVHVAIRARAVSIIASRLGYECYRVRGNDLTRVRSVLHQPDAASADADQRIAGP